MKHVILIRHGATAGNLERRYIGRTDEPLSDRGIEQISKLAGQRLQADVLFISPMLRARQTAEIVFPGKAYAVVPDLRETDFGVFEGKCPDEMAGDPVYRAWLDTNCQAPIPGGEAVEDFKTRCCAAFQTVMAEVSEGRTAAFVIHGGCIMAILEAFAVPQKDFYDYHIKNGAYVLCDAQDGRLTVRCDAAN